MSSSSRPAEPSLAYALRSSWHINPDFIGDVCGELDVPWRSNGYRWFLPKG